MNSVVVRGPGDRRFYLIATLALIGVTLAGFSIDADLIFHLDTLTALVLFHSALMFGWIVMFTVQTFLIAARRVDLHRRLGIVGAALGAMLVVVGVTTLFVAVRLGGDHMPPDADPPVFLAEGLELFFLFGVLGSFGIALRRRSDYHKRLMLLATIPLLDAAIQRFVAAYTHWGIDTPYLRNGLILVCVAVDTVRHRRLHPAFLVGGALILLCDQIPDRIAQTTTWVQFTSWVMSL